MTTTTSPNASPSSVLTPQPSLLLPPGQLTLLIGEPGCGKSLVALDLAARLSRGYPLPPFDHRSTTASTPSLTHPSSPLSTIFYSFEDSPATIAGRLLAAGADCALFHPIQQDLSPIPISVYPEIAELELHTPTPHPLIAKLQRLCARSPKPGLFIIDPLPAILGTGDSYHAATLRARLSPLLDFALNHNLSILGITHLSKPTAQNKNPLHRIIGSLAYSALARAIYHITPDLRDPHTRLVIPLKHNLAPTDTAFAFTIESHPVHLTPGQSPEAASSISPAPILRWHSHAIPNTPAEVASDESQAFEHSQLDFALNFLRTTLTPGPILSANLLRQSRQLGISNRTLARAKFILRTSSQFDPSQSRWLTSLPSSHGSP